MRRLLMTGLLAVVSACGGAMEDARVGDKDRRLATADLPPPLDLIRFTDNFFIPDEFEAATKDGRICVSDDRGDDEAPVSPAIRKIIAGRRWERAGQSSPWAEVNVGQSIRPCAKKSVRLARSGSPLDRLIDRVERMHQLISDLDPVTIELFPAFVNIDGNAKTFATGDMFYDAGRKTIVILPPTSQSAGMHLWESPFLIAHELIHHAIETQVRAESPEKSIPDWCEEGHADAFAFQMTGQNPALVRELPGFGTDRDPSWPRFNDGSRKDEFDLTGAAPLHRKGAALAHRLHLKPAFNLPLEAPFKMLIDQCQGF